MVTCELDDVIDAVICAGKFDELVLDELKPEDLEHISWSGRPSHLRAVAGALNRVAAGEVEYLVIRAPGGVPVAKAGIDYSAHSDAGTFWQLATHSRLHGMGLGTRLITEGERRVRGRRLRWGVIGVEDNNPRARALYERLGYTPWRREYASWQEEDEHGASRLYETKVVLLRKQL